MAVQPPRWYERAADITGYAVAIGSAAALGAAGGFLGHEISTALFDAINSGTAPGIEFYNNIRPYAVGTTTAAGSVGGVAAGLYAGRFVRDFFRNILW